MLKLNIIIRASYTRKIRRELYHLYKHVLSTTKTARVNGSGLISVPDSFEVARSNGNLTWGAF